MVLYFKLKAMKLKPVFMYWRLIYSFWLGLNLNMLFGSSSWGRGTPTLVVSNMVFARPYVTFNRFFSNRRLTFLLGSGSSFQQGVLAIWCLRDHTLFSTVVVFQTGG